MRIVVPLIVFMIALGAMAAASSSMANENISYSYDALGRLTNVSHSGTVNNNMQTNYSFDAADNRNTMTTVNAPH